MMTTSFDPANVRTFRPTSELRYARPRADTGISTAEGRVTSKRNRRNASRCPQAPRHGRTWRTSRAAPWPNLRDNLNDLPDSWRLRFDAQRLTLEATKPIPKKPLGLQTNILAFMAQRFVSNQSKKRRTLTRRYSDEEADWRSS